MNTATIYPEQIERWHECYRNHLINIGRRIGYENEELSDMVGQFFLEILEKNIDVHTIVNPQAYLSTAFRRKLIDHYKKNLKNGFVSGGQIVAEQVEPSPHDRLEQIQTNADLIRTLNRAYKKLPERCQKVVYLKFYKGLNTEQIAEQTGLCKRTVYNNLFERKFSVISQR